MSKKKTRREQAIEQIAWRIYEARAFDPDGSYSDEIIQNTNDADGWTFEVRWHDSEYINDNDYTLVEGYQLNGVDLEEAIRQANAHLERDKNPAAVLLGRKGGTSTSQAKRQASRENGRKGGRPRKDKAAE